MPEDLVIHDEFGVTLRAAGDPDNVELRITDSSSEHIIPLDMDLNNVAMNALHDWLHEILYQDCVDAEGPSPTDDLPSPTPELSGDVPLLGRIELVLRSQ